MSAAEVLAIPAMPILPPPLTEGGETELHGHAVPTFQTMTRYTGPASLAGMPSVSIPVPSDGGPVSVLLEGRRGADVELLSMAAFLFDADADVFDGPNR